MLSLRSAAAVRDQIASSLSVRIPAALSRTQPERIACEIDGLDRLLQGGLPIGTLTEFVGADCSGRISAALAYVAAITRTGSVCAWIDTSDSLDPESAAANGVDLERLLWVRCGPPSPKAAAKSHIQPKRSKRLESLSARPAYRWRQSTPALRRAGHAQSHCRHAARTRRSVRQPGPP